VSNFLQNEYKDRSEKAKEKEHDRSKTYRERVIQQGQREYERSIRDAYMTMGKGFNHCERERERVNVIFKNKSTVMNQSKHQLRKLHLW